MKRNPPPAPPFAKEGSFDLDAFIAQFPVFAGAPNGIANLRALILQLAVQGKLTEQSTHATVKLETLANLISGQHLGAGEQNSRKKGIPYFTGASDFGITYPLVSRWTETPKAIAQQGDILLSVKGTIGRVNLLNLPNAAIGRQVMAVRPVTIQTEYMALVLKANEQYFLDLGVGIAILGISRKDVLNLELLAPPLEEQKRIVAKVDELMVLCDQLEAQQDAQARNLLEASAAVTQALMGRDSFADHWQRIATHFNTLYGCNLPLPTDMRRGKLKNRTVALENVAKLRELILRLAMNGRLTSCQLQKMLLGDVVSFQNGFAFKSSWYQTSGIRLARNVNVSHGILDWGDTQCVSDEIAEECKKFALAEGDLLISLDRPIISTGVKVARVREQDLPCLLLQRVAKPIFEEAIFSSRFLELWFQSPEYSESIDPGRSNGVPHISTKQLSQMQFNLPPLAEQQAIVAKVDELMALCDRLEGLLDEQRQVAAAFSEAAVQAVDGDKR